MSEKPAPAYMLISSVNELDFIPNLIKSEKTQDVS